MRYIEAFMAIASADFKKTVVFYEALLEQPPDALLAGKYAQWRLTGGLKLGVFSPKPEHRDEFAADQAGPISLCLEVDDLDAAIKSLTDLGYPPPEDIQTASHGRELYAYDPDGNRLILHQGWGQETEAPP